MYTALINLSGKSFYKEKRNGLKTLFQTMCLEDSKCSANGFEKSYVLDIDYSNRRDRLNGVIWKPLLIFPHPYNTSDDCAPKQKRFWSFMRRLEKDSSGISPLGSKGEIHSSAEEKAEILNQQFTSVFTQEPPGPLPDKCTSPHPTMPDIRISKEGIEKMLQNIKPDKAAGPDSLPATVLKELSHEIAPIDILELIYCRSIQSGIVPSDCKTATIASIFKKGDTHKASN